jgi:hypothetical protein
MKKPTAVLFILGFIALGAALAWFMHPLRRSSKPAPGAPSATPSVNASGTTPGGASTAAVPSPAVPKPSVAIQDEKTIDFSSGKPVVKDSAEEKAIIERSVKEMNEAAAGITFGPAPKTQPAPKPAQ